MTGEHLRIVAASSLDLSYNKTITHTAVEDLAPGEIGWDDFNVYRMEDDGPVKLVSRPWWYYLTHPTLTWAVSFFSGLAIFIIQATSKIYFLRIWARDFGTAKVSESPEYFVYCGLSEANCCGKRSAQIPKG